MVQESESTLKSVTQRLELTEKRLSELISFFSRVASNPAVLAQMITAAQQNQAYLAGSDARRKKRRADGGSDDSPSATGGQLIPYKPVDVASFFQNLMVSPLPDVDETSAAGADELEKHFNSIDLAATVSPGNAAHHDHVQIHEASSADSPGIAALDDECGLADADAMGIEVPPELAGGMPSIGLSAPGVEPMRNDQLGTAAAVDGAAMGAQGFFAVPLSGTAGIPSAPDAVGGSVLPPFSSSLPDPDAFSFDDLEMPADLSLDGIGDLLKGDGSVGELPDLKEDTWHHMTDVDAPTPTATS